MFSRIREHFGTAGLVVAIVALIAALGGAAVAATGGSGNGKATASAKGKQGPRGKTGKTGPAGPQGPAGPAGAAGPAGSDGSDGLNGKDGKNGTNGTNGVNGEVGATGATGAAGATGATGATGFSGFTETLTSNKTETGTWSLGFVSAGTINATPFIEPIYLPISFPIPLAAELASTNVHYLNKAGKEVLGSIGSEEKTSTSCTGTAANPTAAAGHLCVYTQNETTAATFFEGWPAVGKPSSNVTGEGAAKNGALLKTFPKAAGARAFGTWAVTAP